MTSSDADNNSDLLSAYEEVMFVAISIGFGNGRYQRLLFTFVI